MEFSTLKGKYVYSIIQVSFDMIHFICSDGVYQLAIESQHEEEPILIKVEGEHTRALHKKISDAYVGNGVYVIELMSVDKVEITPLNGLTETVEAKFEMLYKYSEDKMEV